MRLRRKRLWSVRHNYNIRERRAGCRGRDVLARARSAYDLRACARQRERARGWVARVSTPHTREGNVFPLRAPATCSRTPLAHRPPVTSFATNCHGRHDDHALRRPSHVATTHPLAHLRFGRCVIYVPGNSLPAAPLLNPSPSPSAVACVWIRRRPSSPDAAGRPAGPSPTPCPDDSATCRCRSTTAAAVWVVVATINILFNSTETSGAQSVSIRRRPPNSLVSTWRRFPPAPPVREISLHRGPRRTRAILNFRLFPWQEGTRTQSSDLRFGHHWPARPWAKQSQIKNSNIVLIFVCYRSAACPPAGHRRRGAVYNLSVTQG